MISRYRYLNSCHEVMIEAHYLAVYQNQSQSEEKNSHTSFGNANNGYIGISQQNSKMNWQEMAQIAREPL